MSGTSVAVFGDCGDTVPPADSIGVGPAVGGHYHTVPHGGHGKSGEFRENTLAAPCMLEHIRPSLRQGNQELDSRLACSV